MHDETLEHDPSNVIHGRAAVEAIDACYWKIGRLAVEAAAQGSVKRFAEELDMPYAKLLKCREVHEAFPTPADHVPGMGFDSHARLAKMSKGKRANVLSGLAEVPEGQREKVFAALAR